VKEAPEDVYLFYDLESGVVQDAHKLHLIEEIEDEDYE